MRSTPRTIPRAAGFTLVELMIVIAISAILVALAIPAFDPVRAAARTREFGNELQMAVLLARSEAIRRNAVVSICRSANAGDGSPACSDLAVGAYAGGDWAAGWIVFAKTGGADATQFQGGDTVLSRRIADDAGGTVRTLAISSSAPQVVAFRGDGTLEAGPVGGTIFSIDHRKLAGSASPALRCLGLNQIGRVRVFAPAPACA